MRLPKSLSESPGALLFVCFFIFIFIFFPVSPR